MAGHFPFGQKRGSRYGRAPRMAISGFFEYHDFGKEQQEQYYRWWYDWAKSFVENDPDLNATMGWLFKSYPMGQHAEHGFHLHDRYWAMNMEELGSFIANSIFPKMTEEQMHKLEEDHEALVERLSEEAKEHGAEPTPDVGYFRHV